MSTDKSGIRIKRVGPDEETAALPVPGETSDAPRRRTTPPRTRAGTGPAVVDDDAPAAPVQAHDGSGVTDADSARPREHEVSADHDARGAGMPDRPRDTGRRGAKPFFLSSEFLLTMATIAGVLVAGYLRDDSLNAWRIWLLVSVVASAYVLSRGIAKAGSSGRH